MKRARATNSSIPTMNRNSGLIGSVPKLPRFGEMQPHRFSNDVAVSFSGNPPFHGQPANQVSRHWMYPGSSYGNTLPSPRAPIQPVSSAQNRLRRPEVPMIPCEHCPAFFMTENAIYNHLLDVHKIRPRANYSAAPPAPVYPNLEQQQYGNWSTQSRFNGTKRSNRMFPCDRCGKEFKLLFALEQHKATAHRSDMEESETICEICNRYFKTFAHYQQHRVAAHEKGKSYGVSETLTKTAKGYNCTRCTKFFTKYLGLVAHNRTKHNEMHDVFVCKACDEAFNKQEALESHDCSASLQKDVFQCPDCDLKLASQEKYERHWHFAHNKHNLFNCPTCKKPFFDEVAFQQHCVAHKPGDKERFKFSCNFCDQLFDRMPNVEQHMRMYHRNVGDLTSKICIQCCKFYEALPTYTRGLCDFCQHSKQDTGNVSAPMSLVEDAQSKLKQF